MPANNLVSLLAVLVVGGCGATASPPPPRSPAPQVSEEEGQAAYDARDYARCAALFATRATQVSGRDQARAFYTAASCHARAGQADLAFAELDRSADFAQSDVEQDPDLEVLHGDPRWPRFVAATSARLDIGIADPALRHELAALVAVDQAARKAWVGHIDDAALADAVHAIDEKTTARMKEIVAKLGWPGKLLIGKDGAHSAWLLVQHADKDPAFQAQCLRAMEPLLGSGEVDATDYAYLYDRVAVADGHKQRYGTQFENHEPAPIEDEAGVDLRRKQVGLGTMAEYKEKMRRHYGPKK